MAAGQDPEGAQVSSAWRAWHAGRVTPGRQSCVAHCLSVHHRNRLLLTPGFGAQTKPEQAAIIFEGHAYNLFMASLPSVTDKSRMDQMSSNRSALKMKYCCLEN